MINDEAAMTLTLTRESPLADDLALLFQRHHAHCHADTPPESIHMIDRTGLAASGVAFYVLRDHGQPLAMGAIKVIEPGHGEIKSMHVLDEARGRGLARRMVDHLIAAATGMGLTRLSLETGAQESFGAARSLYAAAGFADCAPFIGYRYDPMSVFMTKSLN